MTMLMNIMIIVIMNDQGGITCGAIDDDCDDVVMATMFISTTIS